MANDWIPADRLIAELVGVYREAAERLRGQVNAAMRSGALGTQGYLERQLRSVQLELDRLRRQGREMGPAVVDRSYRTSVRAVDITTDLQAGFGGATHKRALAVLVDNMVAGLDRAAVTVGRRTEDAFRAAALRETAIAAAAGAKRTELSAALEQRLIDEGVTDAMTGFVDRAGRRWELSTYVEMVARTTTREAVTAGTVMRLQEHGLDLVQISQHRNSCTICLPFQGRTYSLSGRDDRYPRAEQLPPFHPNCRHVAHPASTTLDDFEKALGIADQEQQRQLQQPAPEPEPEPEPAGATLEQRAAEIRAAIGDPLDLTPARLRQVGELVERAAEEFRQDEVIADQLLDVHNERTALVETTMARVPDDRLEDWRDYFTDAERDRYLRLNSREAELSQARNTEQQERYLRVLRAVRPGYGTAQVRTRSRTLKPQLERAGALLPKEWVDAVQAGSGGAIRANVQPRGRRAFYQPADNTVHVQRGAESTTLHELGHAVEDHHQAVIFDLRAFYNERVGVGDDEEPIAELQRVQPGRGYASHEITILDQFATPYIGKWYGGVARDPNTRRRTGRETTATTAYEILTMGLEAVFYDRHDVRERDPDHLHFTLGLLAGR